MQRHPIVLIASQLLIVAALPSCTPPQTQSNVRAPEMSTLAPPVGVSSEGSDLANAEPETELYSDDDVVHGGSRTAKLLEKTISPELPLLAEPKVHPYQLDAIIARHRKAVGRLTYGQLKARHRPAYLDHHGLNVQKARFYSGFVKTFGLSSRERGVLAREGFVVVPSPSRRNGESKSNAGAGPADIFYRVFAADLPVFVSADSILHAWHRSFDKMLERTEEEHLSLVLGEMLDSMAMALDAGRQDERDALLYVSVALQLLQQEGFELGSVEAEAQPLLDAIQNEAPAEVSFMGDEVLMDFSQFIPRGHYTRSWELSRYFQAMMWLGRTDLVLYDPSLDTPPNPRMEAAARALARTLLRDSVASRHRELDAFYSRVTGPASTLTPQDMFDLCAAARLPDCEGDGAAMTPLYAAAGPAAYSGRLRSMDQAAVTFRVLPQRFGYDSWITSQATMPHLQPNVEGGRSMASTLDVAFVLGSDRAVDYMAEEMDRPYRENLPTTLEALRRTYNGVRPTDFGGSVYNHWLEGLMALSEPQVGDELPQVMRTRAWHDRRLEAVLGSWAELRHDAILSAHQSYGAFGCQYPEGYVEPVPELYRALARAAATLRPIYALRQIDGGPSLEFFVHFEDTMERLALLSERELAGDPMTQLDLDFLNHTVDQHTLNEYDGTRQYDGWYPRLFWFGRNRSGLSEPVVSDVHTDADRGQALQVGVGHPELLIVALDGDGGSGIYGGPAFSFYEFANPITERMSDDQWIDRVNDGNLPQRPAFARGYR